MTCTCAYHDQLIEIRIRINRKADCLGIVRFFCLLAHASSLKAT